MTSITFDTLAYVKTLRDAGFNDSQSEAQANALANVLRSGTDELATKRDLERLATKGDVQRLDYEIRLLKWMVGLSIALSTATLALLTRVAISLLLRTP